MMKKRFMTFMLIIIFVLSIGLMILYFHRTNLNKNNKVKPNEEIIDIDNNQEIIEEENETEEEIIEEVKEDELDNEKDDNKVIDNKNNDKKKNNNTNKSSETKKDNKDNKKEEEVIVNNDKKVEETPPKEVVDNNFKIVEDGIYNLTGDYNCISVNTNSDITINLINANIKCNDNPGINVLSNSKIIITLGGNNTIDVNTNETLHAAIYSKNDIELLGSGSLTIKSNIDGIFTEKKIIFKGGTYTINSDDDGIVGKDNIQLSNVNMTINSQGDGIKSSNSDQTKGFINISSGIYNINSLRDAIDASNYIEVSGGTFNIKTKDGSKKKTDSSSKGLKADQNIIIKNGTFTFDTSDDAIHSNNNINIFGGNITIQTADDAIHADNNIEIKNVMINIKKAFEGIEGHIINIYSGNITILSTDDGINAVHPELGEKDKNHSSKLTIFGGTTKIVSYGDGIDSNGVIEINGGNVYVESFARKIESALDYDSKLIVNKGTFIALALTKGADDIGVMETKIPMLVANLKGFDALSLGSVNYKPTLEEYNYLIIASDKLEVGENVLKVYNHTINVNLINDITEYNE